jgi:tetraacyldisaccharide 4'-kinase
MPEVSAAQRFIERRWYGARAPWWLLPFSWLFGCGVRLRRWAYRTGVFASRHPGVPVVVVGNLTVGGAGKTPLVIWLATQLRKRGMRVGIVLRGYGGSARVPTLVSADSDPLVVGDEALLLAQRTDCTVCVGRDRAAAAERLVAEGCQLILADDGLQHLALRRDVEIVVIDGVRGFGNGALLPAGPLREPLTRIRMADVVVVNGEPAAALATVVGHPPVMQLRPVELVQLNTGARSPLEMLRGRRVHAVAGIGHPARFFAQLRTLGALIEEHAFADHQRYLPHDLTFDGAGLIVMTEKDAVKCRALANDRMWMLTVEALLTESDAARLLAQVRNCTTTRGA